ncbi:MAG: dUTP diphosphatase [Patescibacteria group bacterium]
MNLTPGKFIVIDGTDGSGKTTQLKLLKSRLEEAGLVVAMADFPQYNTKSAGLVEEYLSGKYGKAEEIDAYKASIFYAVDRYDASFQIRRWLAEGKIVLSNRYTSANMGHQGAKIANPLERKVFFNWLYDLEYKIFEIPRPDLSIILHVEADLAQRLAQERGRTDWNGKTTDIHEENLDHLQKAEQIYLEIAASFTDFKLINCTKNGRILDREEVSLLIWPAVNRILDGQTNNQDFQSIGNIIGGNRQIVNNREAVFERPPVAEKPSAAPAVPGILKVERLNAQAKLPQKAHPGDAAYDLYANDYYSIAPYAQALVSTGLKLAIPDGQVGLIWDKSGLAATGITMLGGVIDSNYRGEIKIVVKNLSEEIFNITAGQKIAQILIQTVSDLEVREEKIEDETARASKGFGSSGKF